MIVLLVGCPASAVQQPLAALPCRRFLQSDLTCSFFSNNRNILSPLQDSWPLPLLWMVVAFRLEVTVAVALRPFSFPLHLGAAPNCIGKETKKECEW